MKKRILAVLPMLLLLSLTTFAQLEKGTILLGGGVGFSSSTSKTEEDVPSITSSQNSFNFSPDLGYFVADHWVVGLSVPLSWQNSETEFTANASKSTSKSSSVGAAPFVRRYFPFGEKMAAYGQLSLGYSHHSSEIRQNGSTDPSSTTDAKSFNAAATLGLSYFPKTWMAVNLSVSPLGYVHGSSQQTGNGSFSETSSSGFNFGLDTSAITLGANFFLTKK